MAPRPRRPDTADLKPTPETQGARMDPERRWLALRIVLAAVALAALMPRAW
jgi:hypothetical protein